MNGQGIPCIIGQLAMGSAAPHFQETTRCRRCPEKAGRCLLTIVELSEGTVALSGKPDVSDQHDGSPTRENVKAGLQCSSSGLVF